MNHALSAGEEADLLEYLQEKLRGSDLVPENFAEALKECAADPAYAAVLKEWAMKKSFRYMTDIRVKGYSLKEMAEYYSDGDVPDPRFGVLMSLPVLYLEEHEPEYSGIAEFAGLVCCADRNALKQGIPMGFAFRTDDGCWHFVGEREDMLSIEACEGLFTLCDLWTVLLDNPAFIGPLLEDPPPGTSVFLMRDEHGTSVNVLPPWRSEEGDSA